VSGLICDNFETYGTDADLMLDGINSAQEGATLDVPTFDTEGRVWLHLSSANGAMRRPTGSALASAGFFARFYLPQLPASVGRCAVGGFFDGTNTLVAQLRVQPDGVLILVNAAGTTIATSTTPVIRAGTLHKIQAELEFNGGAGTAEVRVDDTVVINAGTLSMAGTGNIFCLGIGSDGLRTTTYFKDYAVYSLGGTYNNSWPAITGVGTTLVNADTVDAGMTPRPRQIIEAGVLQVPGTGSLLDCGVDTDYDLGSADFTLEVFYRPTEPVTGSNFATLFGKWSASTSKRSYRLVQYGPDVNDGALQWQITTDGTLATLQTVLSIIYPFEVGHIYAIAIERESGLTRIYVDGEQVGLDQPDAYTYFAAGLNAKFTVGGEMSGVATSVLSSSSVDAIFDEIRVTPGVARYSANYTPTTTPYPRSAPSDPNFASVVLLAGFDESVVDESSMGQTLTARGTAARLVPDDAAFDYEVLNAVAPLDDRYLESAFISATGILTLTANPANNETVTLGASVYTFKTVVGAAGTVLIGTDEEASLVNLAAAINGDAGSGTLYGTGTVTNVSATAAIEPTPAQLTATAITAGAAGNSIASTETLAAGAWSNATLAGGADIPGPSRFDLETLPVTVTGIRWLELRNRSYTSGGAANLQATFQVNGADAAGTDRALTTAPTNYFDVVEEDPDTAGALTPTSINNGSLQLERTA
jgi:hypothetical protein